MKKRLFVMISALILLLGIAHAEGEIVSKEQLNEPGRKIGVSQGSAAEEAVMAEMPKAEIAYFTDNLLGYTAVAQGKIDAFVYDRIQMQLTIDLIGEAAEKKEEYTPKHAAETKPSGIVLDFTSFL